MQWCNAYLEGLGLDRNKEDDAEWLFTNYYVQLRAAVQEHLNQENQMNLSKCCRPLVGGLGELKRRFAGRGSFRSVEAMKHAIQAEQEEIHGDEILNFENAL
ncbi:hypothetical protein GGS21DRAFT_502908 [Xylaria nigripes]|nr:hypothetical protein GGS21DRAFT_502908 [Xylaria nigripes]